MNSMRQGIIPSDTMRGLHPVEDILASLRWRQVQTPNACRVDQVKRFLLYTVIDANSLSYASTITSKCYVGKDAIIVF
jgi:hypothetical protein